MQPEEFVAEDRMSRQELLLALGRLVLEFGQLDEALHDALFVATDRREETRILTSGLRFPDLVARFEAIYAGFADPSTNDRGVRELCTLLRQLNEERNREIHAVWGFYADSGHPLRTQHRLKRGSMALRIESVAPSELNALAQRMADATDKVWEIVIDFDRQRRSAGGEALLAQRED